jgi:hypothetical protein
METDVTGKYVIYTQIEYITEIESLDINNFQTIATPYYYETKEQAIDEMILKLMELKNNKRA